MYVPAAGATAVTYEQVPPLNDKLRDSTVPALLTRIKRVLPEQTAPAMFVVPARMTAPAGTLAIMQGVNEVNAAE